MLENYHSSNNFPSPHFFLFSCTIIFTLKFKKSLTAKYINLMRKIRNNSDSLIILTRQESISPALYIYTANVDYEFQIPNSIDLETCTDQCVVFFYTYDLKTIFCERVYSYLAQLRS